MAAPPEICGTPVEAWARRAVGEGVSSIRFPARKVGEGFRLLKNSRMLLSES
jgi:hypothetical protein